MIRRTRPRQKDCYACTEYNFDWFANDLEEPYTTPAGQAVQLAGTHARHRRPHQRLGPPELPVQRSRFQGGSRSTATATTGRSATRTWPRTTTSSRDYVGITGHAEGVPELPDGKFQPPMPLTCAETRLRTRGEGEVRPHGHDRPRRQPHQADQRTQRLPLLRPVRARLRRRTRISTRRSRPSPTRWQTGNCTLIPNAMVYKVVDGSRRATARGVLYIDRVTREPREVTDAWSILCAQALESVRILLNSATRRFPNGLANSSGVLGHYLMDHIWVAGGATGEFPDMPGQAVTRRAAPAQRHLRRSASATRRRGHAAKDFLRGYGFQGGWGGPDFNWSAPGFGEAYKKALLELGHDAESRRLRRVPAALRQLGRARSRRRGRVRHPRAAASA